MVQGFARLESVSIAIKGATSSSEHESEFISLPEELYAHAQLALLRGLELEYKGCKQTTWAADLDIYFRALKEPRLVISASIDRTYENDEGVVHKFDFSISWNLYLPKSEFQNFVERLKFGFATSISFDLLNPLKTSDEELLVTSGIVDLNVVYYLGIAKTPNWYAGSISRQADLVLEPLALSTGSQVHKILLELSQSAGNADRILRADDKELTTIREMISDLRASLRKREQDLSGQYAYSTLWFAQPAEFLERISQFDAVRRKELTKQYDIVWATFNLSNIIAIGEEEMGARKIGFDPTSDELELVAHQLLQLRPLRSKTLEKILVNALLYAETIEFARIVLSKEKSYGVRISSTVRKTELFTGKAIVLLLWELLFEVLKVGLTVGVSFLITSENATAAWVVATGFTLFRWWYNTFTAGQKDNIKEHKLLQEMCDVHQLSNNQNYNPRLLRNRLYEVSSQGAIFSPLIFSILDMQIREVDSQS